MIGKRCPSEHAEVLSRQKRVGQDKTSGGRDGGRGERLEL
jgi:hypothetical protein